MAANSLLAGAAQILCYIALRGAKGANSTLIARSLKTNPVFVRRILKDLERHGLVEIGRVVMAGWRFFALPTTSP